MDIQTVLMDNLGSITSFVVSITAVGYIWTNARKVLTQAGELIAVVVDAMQDNSLTAEEVKRIIKEGGDVVGAVKQALANSKVK